MSLGEQAVALVDVPGDGDGSAITVAGASSEGCQDGPVTFFAGRGMTERRTYRTFTPEQKLATVLAGLRGDRTVKEVCLGHEISDPFTTSGATSS